VYENVIVPFDGSLPARAALAPAADLAWRCGARIVIVNNTEASDQASRDALKARAMSMSGADVDFWVDLDRSIGRALVDAAKFRDDPIVCVPVRARTQGWRRKPVFNAMAAEVLVEAPAPVLVIGPEADVSAGLGVREIIVALDGSAAAEQILPTVADWARTLKLRVVLVGVVRDGAGGEATHTGETAYLRAHAEKLARELGDVDYELVEAVDPATGICDRLERNPDAIVAMTTHGRTGVSAKPLGSVAQTVMLRSMRPVLFLRTRR
jgi:nucleotide-binding universal stress UspA family protein